MLEERLSDVVAPLSYFGKFLEVALGDFLHVGAILPSSSFASRAIASQLPEHPSRTVEYGPGNGSVTRELLRHVPEGGKLTGIEVNERFYHELEKIGDHRLELVHGDVVEVTAKLAAQHPGTFAAAVSGIPFSFISTAQAEHLLESTRKLLRPGGRFVVYQNSPRVLPLLKAHFASVKLTFEPRNIFPYFIMVASSGDDAADPRNGNGKPNGNGRANGHGRKNGKKPGPARA